MAKYRKRISIATVLLLAVVAANYAGAQTFDTIINVPPDVEPGVIDSNTQLNVFDGGVISNGSSAGFPGQTHVNMQVNVFGGLVGNHFSSREGSQVTISGGSVGDEFEAFSGSQVSITGGIVGNSFTALKDSHVTISGGMVGSHFGAQGSTVTISGGSLGGGLIAFEGSEVTISGGSFGDDFTAVAGSRVAISGGSMGDEFVTRDGSEMTITGGSFRLDGAEIDAVASSGQSAVVEIPSGALFTGVLADGIPFAFHSEDLSMTGNPGDQFASGTLRLSAVSLPMVGQTIVTGSADPVPQGIREGQTLLLDAGSVGPDHFNAGVGSTVEIQEGGVAGRNLESVGATVTISGGQVGRGFDAFRGSMVTISGGLVNDDFDAFEGSQVTITGGAFRLDGVVIDTVTSPGQIVAVDVPGGAVLSGVLADGTPFAFHPGDRDKFASGTLRLSAVALPALGPALITGSVDPIPQGIRQGQTLLLDAGAEAPDHFSAEVGSTVEVQEGGVMGDNFEAVGTRVTISGGEVGGGFDVLGGSEVTISGGEVERGMSAGGGSKVTLSGGSVGDNFGTNGELMISGGEVGRGFNALPGSRVTISGGSVGNGFGAFSFSEVTISGGSVGNGFGAFSFSKVMMSGGSVGRFSAALNSQLTISGGVVGDDFRALDRSEVTITGGKVGDSFEADAGSKVTITGGTIGADFAARRGGEVTISGGTIGDGFRANNGSTVNLVGLSFALDGEDFGDELTLGQPFTLHDRDVSLSGLLADGSQFNFELNSIFQSSEDFFSPGTTLTLRLVPEPGSAVVTLLGIVVLISPGAFRRQRHTGRRCGRS